MDVTKKKDRERVKGERRRERERGGREGWIESRMLKREKRETQ